MLTTQLLVTGTAQDMRWYQRYRLLSITIRKVEGGEQNGVWASHRRRQGKKKQYKQKGVTADKQLTVAAAA
jgi:hypothetical protein